MFKILKDLGSIAENINQTPYDDDSSVSYLIERNNKEYILTKNNFYNDISGIHKWDLNIYENNNEKCGKLIYNHYEYFVDDITLKSKQDIFEVDDEFLKDLTEFAGKDLPLERKKLPSEREMLVEYIEEMKKSGIDIAPNSKSKRVLNFYEKANEYLDKFKNLDKDILKKYNLQNEKISIFPSFKVKTKYGIPFDSSIDTTINKELENVISQTLSYKYLENMDIYNMKDWKILEAKGLVTIIPNIEENKEKTKEYSIKEILINNFFKNPEFIEKFEKDYIDSEISKNKEKIKMEKEILTLENFNEKALELLKKENYGSDVITVDWDRNASLTKKDMAEILRIKEQYKYDDWKDVIPMYVDDNWGVYENISEVENFLIDDVLNKYVDYSEDSDEYDEIRTKLLEKIHDYFSTDYDIDTLIRNTKADELDIFLISDSKKTLEDEIDNIAMFEEYKKLERNLDSDNFNAIAFLVQSQGYELEDLYNKEKVENSKFLKSLQSEIEENYDGGSIVFSKIGVDLQEVLELQDNKDNIIIPKDGLYVGIHNVANGSSSMLEVKLEKEIILNRKNVKIMSDYGESEGYLIQEVNGMIDTKYEINFKTTTEKGFEQHQVNVEKVLEQAQKYFEVDEMEIFSRKSEEKYRDNLDKIQMLTNDLFYGKKVFPLSERENNNLMDKSFKELVNDAISYAMKDLEKLKKEMTSDIELGNKISNLTVKSLEDLFMKSDFELKHNYLGKKSEEFGLNLMDFSDPENPENYRKNIDDFLKSKITNEFINVSIDTTDELRKKDFEIPSLENNIFKEYDNLKQNLYNAWRERQEDLLVTGADVDIDYKNKTVQKEIKELMKDILRKDETNIEEIENFEKKYNKEHSIDDTISHKKNLIKEYNKISEKSEEITKQKEF